MEFGTFIKNRRKELNKTQQTVAEECNISFQSIGKWERGDSLPTADKIPLLSKSLMLSAQELFDLEKYQDSTPIEKDFDKTKFCAMLAQLRGIAGLTQQDVAMQLSVSQSTVAKWESEKTIPDIEMLKNICALYNVDADELYNYTLKEQPTKSGAIDNYRIGKIKKSQRKLKILLSVAVVIILCASIVLSIFMFKSKNLLQDKEIKTIMLVNELTQKETLVYELPLDDVLTLEKPSKQGYIFAGWNDKSDGSGITYPYTLHITQDLILYAQWQPIWIDGRVYGENSDKVIELLANIDTDLQRYFDYFDEKMSCLVPIDIETGEMKEPSDLTTWGIFQSTASYSESYEIYYHKLIAESYAEQIQEIVYSDDRMNSFRTSADQLVEWLDTLALGSFITYTPDDGEWTKEYVDFAKNDYYEDVEYVLSAISYHMNYSQYSITIVERFKEKYPGI